MTPYEGIFVGNSRQDENGDDSGDLRTRCSKQPLRSRWAYHRNRSAKSDLICPNQRVSIDVKGVLSSTCSAWESSVNAKGNVRANAFNLIRRGPLASSGSLGFACKEPDNMPRVFLVDSSNPNTSLIVVGDKIV